MRFLTLVLAATASAALFHHDRRHDHRHVHPHRIKRAPEVVTKAVYVGPTITVYELNGQLISEDEVKQGIANGTLRLGDDGVISSAPPTTSTAGAAVFAEAYTSVPSVSSESSESSSTPPPPSSSSSTPTPTPTPTPSSTPAPKSSAAPTSASSSYSNSASAGIDQDYDESLDCSTFPSAWGPVAVDYLNLGGWTGIQSPGYSGSDGYNNIETKTTCSGGSCCVEGAFCSYACPEGYQKTQWPSNQGVTGQSVGGLQCSNGKLKLTRGDVTKKLCEKGTSKVSIKVKNTMSKGAAICRTDYPGTEAETIPVWASAGSSAELACPDGASYYLKDGKPTSGQYYVNPAGVSVENGCQWGDPSKPWGNYAPLNLGVGYSDGKGWISIFQNAPTTDAKLDFSIEIQGDNIDGKCRYSNGKYCSGNNYDNCNSKEGCTVAVRSGTAYFVFS